jgi:hypothetical protein
MNNSLRWILLIPGAYICATLIAVVAAVFFRFQGLLIGTNEQGWHELYFVPIIISILYTIGFISAAHFIAPKWKTISSSILLGTLVISSSILSTYGFIQSEGDAIFGDPIILHAVRITIYLVAGLITINHLHNKGGF